MLPVDSTQMQGLHPVAQITLIIVGGIVFLGILLACFTDFWDNISKRK